MAEIPINAGLSGLWHNNDTPGQGILLDVIETNENLFAGWFTYHPNNTNDDNGYWLTLQGPYQSSVAELVVYQTTGGQFNQTTEVATNPVGLATLIFNSCTEAIFNVELSELQVNQSIQMSRVTPDVFCADRISDVTETEALAYNYPPKVARLETTIIDDEVLITFDLADAENDTLSLAIWVESNANDSYQIPTSHLTGHVNFPVLTGTQKNIRWNYANDLGFQQLGINNFKLKVVADDRYLNTIQDVVDAVSEARLVADIEAMEGVRHHQAAPNGLTNTRNYIRTQMNALPLEVEEMNFTHLGSTGINLIGALPGYETADEIYIIDGHYDTVASTPGADDNASGTAGMLEAMRVLSQFNSKKTIKFIAFDKEELGLVGSRYYANNLNPSDQIKGLINFEMIGYTCTSQPECVQFPNADTSIYNIKSAFANTLSDAFMATGATHVPALKITAVTDDGDFNFRRSDHAPFWDLGIDALFLTDGANFRTPHYHQSTDRLQTLDTQFMTQVVKTAVGTLAKLAEISHTGQAVSDTLQLNQTF